MTETETPLVRHEYSLAETSKVIKRVLGVFFPNTRFSVTSDSYSGGCSIDARWTDGPAGVNGILDWFERCGFDGMQDLKTYHGDVTWEGHRFVFRGDYVRGERRLSASSLLLACERFTTETSLESPELRDSDGSYPYVVREGGPCGFRFWNHQRDEYPDGVICRDDQSNDSAADVVNAIANAASYEQPAFPITKDNVLRAVLGELTATTTPPAVGGGGVQVSRNEAKDGIEIRFPEKPDSSVLDTLKASGWRWSRFAKCWYSKYTPERWSFAHSLQSAR